MTELCTIEIAVHFLNHWVPFHFDNKVNVERMCKCCDCEKAHYDQKSLPCTFIDIEGPACQ